MLMLMLIAYALGLGLALGLVVDLVMVIVKAMNDSGRETTASFNFHFKTSVDNITPFDHKNTSRLHPVVCWSDHSLSTTKSNHPPSSWLLLGLQAGCWSNVR